MTMRFCNSYSTRIWTAVSFLDDEYCGGEGGRWRARGWWGINPGSCVQVHSGIVSNVNRYWYYYAVADDGTMWAGDYFHYVQDPEAFDLCQGIGSTAYEGADFRELDIGDADDYTLTFTP